MAPLICPKGGLAGGPGGGLRGKTAQGPFPRVVRGFLACLLLGRDQTGLRSARFLGRRGAFGVESEGGASERRSRALRVDVRLQDVGC